MPARDPLSFSPRFVCFGALVASVALAGSVTLAACGGDESSSGSAAAGTSASSGTAGGGGDMGIGGNFTTSTTASSTTGSSTTSGSGGAPPMCDPETGGAFTFAKSFGDASDQFIAGVAVDAGGSIFVVGTYTGSVNFGGGALTAVNSTDIFLARFDANGNHLWSKSFGGNKSQTGTAIALDSVGNVFITGFFYDTVNFGGGTLQAKSNGSVNSFQDSFVAKFDASGNHLWSKNFGDINTEYGYGLAVDGNGSVILTGVFQTPSVNFGGATLTNQGGFDAYVAKLDGSGNHVWSMAFGDVADQYGRTVTTDAQGNVFLAGDFAGSINFGGGALTAAGTTAAFVTKFNAAGQHQWSKSFGESSAIAYGVGVSAAGDVFLGGDFHGTLDFGGGVSLSGAAANDDVFVARLDGTGNAKWAKGFGDPLAQHMKAMRLDDAGNVLLTGSFGGKINFGTGDLATAGAFDMFAAKLEPEAGCPLWSRAFGSPEYQEGLAVDVDGQGNAVLGAVYSGTVDWGGGPLTSATNDALILKLAP
jgi:hypothetical protein